MPSYDVNWRNNKAFGRRQNADKRKQSTDKMKQSALRYVPQWCAPLPLRGTASSGAKLQHRRNTRMIKLRIYSSICRYLQSAPSSSSLEPAAGEGHRMPTRLQASCSHTRDCRTRRISHKSSNGPKAGFRPHGYTSILGSGRATREAKVGPSP